MEEVLRKVQHANKVIKIISDPEPFNPRTEYDNITIIDYWSSRYILGDKKIEPCTKEEMIANAERAGDPILAILPLYAYIHSGVTVSTGSFSCSWDSGQAGWAYITKSKSDMMGCNDFSAEKYEEAIRSDVQTFDYYLTGQTYQYIVEGQDGDVLESSGGYFGSIDDCLVDAKDASERAEDPAIERNRLAKARELVIAKAEACAASFKRGDDRILRERLDIELYDAVEQLGKK